MLGVGLGITGRALLPNLVNPASWLTSAGGGTGHATVSNGILTIAGDGTNAATADQQLTTVPGRTYRITANVATNAIAWTAGTIQGGADVAAQVLTSAGATLSTTFVATGTSTWIRFAKTSVGDSVVSNIAVR